jgi:protein ImuB
MARISESFSLFAGELPATSAARVSLPQRPQQLWIAIDLPDLALCERSARAARENLAALAASAYELTSLVSLEWPDGLLLEVQGSLKLFGGLAAIKSKLAAELGKRRMRGNSCAAPTPLAALWLARQAQADVFESCALPGRLSTLPLGATRWPDDVLVQLAEMGVHTVGDCLRLPRDGLARRVGEQYLRQLDKALGKQPDPRLEFKSEAVLRKTVELGNEITQTETLAGALQSIVFELASELRKLQLQVQSVEVVFHHARAPVTREKLQLIEPVHEAQRLFDPLMVRLERIVLPAPVIALDISGTPVAMRLEEAELFVDRAAPGEKSAVPAALVESLRARFGVEGVYGLDLVTDHRPERVWMRRTEKLLHGSTGSAQPASSAPDRPLWILPAPAQLTAVAAAACREALAGEQRADAPERIESGWWDGRDIRRDYYAVVIGDGQRLWVYQDCGTRDWYLHGIFG